VNYPLSDEGKSTPPPALTVIIPALNESASIESTVKRLQQTLAPIPHEIIVVDDGSTDGTGNIAIKAGAKLIRHPQPGGYGNALKSGICASSHELIAIVDADGTYPVERFLDLYGVVAYDGVHMAVGDRQGDHYYGGHVKKIARYIFTFLTEFSAGRKIPDVNSGMRVFRKKDVMDFYETLCSGFSFTTTITLAYLFKSYYIRYIPIDYFEREGKSKVNHFKDSLRSLQIIVQSILYYNPLKIYVCLLGLLSLSFLVCALFVFANAAASLLAFVFLAFFWGILGMGFLGVICSNLGSILKEQRRTKHEYSHFVETMSVGDSFCAVPGPAKPEMS